MSLTAIDYPSKESYLLILFEYDVIRVGYTNWASDILDNADVYQSTPTLSVSLPPNSALFKENSCVLDLPLDSFTDSIASGEAHAPISVTIREFSKIFEAGPPSDSLTIYRGTLSRTIRNHRQRNDRVVLFLKNIKNYVESPIGFQANHHCAWTFGGAGCLANPTAQIQQPTVAAVTQKKLTVTSLTVPAAPGGDNTRLFHKGFLEKDGLRIGIRDWVSSNPLEFQVIRRPPSSWVSEIINVVPGCDKTIEGCRARWNNEQYFGGFGYAMPAYYPIFETI